MPSGSELYLLPKSSITGLPSGDVVYEHGDSCTCMWFVAAGELRYSLKDQMISSQGSSLLFDASDVAGSSENVHKGRWLSEATLCMQRVLCQCWAENHPLRAAPAHVQKATS